jgi:hypothetical protein
VAQVAPLFDTITTPDFAKPACGGERDVLGVANVEHALVAELPLGGSSAVAGVRRWSCRRGRKRRGPYPVTTSLLFVTTPEPMTSAL